MSFVPLLRSAGAVSVLVEVEPDNTSRAANLRFHRTSRYDCFSSFSACSSQNRMSISRYIVVAVVRCSCARSR